MNNIIYEKIVRVHNELEIINNTLSKNNVYYNSNLFKKIIWELDRIKRYYINNNLLIKDQSGIQIIENNKIDEIHLMLKQLISEKEL